MMIRDVSYTLHVLERIALPILCSTFKKGLPRTEEIPTIQSLLDQSTKLTKDLEQIVTQSTPQPIDHATRIKLAAIATQTIVSNFENDSETPDDNQHLIQAIQKVLERAENFEFTQKLENEENAGSESDPSQDISKATEYLNAFIPIINEISVFSYGQTEERLIQHVSDTLLRHSSEMCNLIIGKIDDTENEDQTRLAFLRVLAALYAHTHHSETQKILQMSEKARQENGSQLTIDIVWRTFHKKRSMLAALIEGLIPTQKSNQTPIDSESSIPATPEASPPEAPAAKEPPPQSSPLSFYKKTSKS